MNHEISRYPNTRAHFPLITNQFHASCAALKTDKQRIFIGRYRRSALPRPIDFGQNYIKKYFNAGGVS